MIILKKEVNALFSAAGLPELTIDLQKGGLWIVGRECGQPLMLINGVVPKQTMTKEVRNIVIDDYIKPVISTYAKDFKVFIDKAMKLKALEKKLDAETQKILANKSLKGYTLHTNISRNYKLQITETAFRVCDKNNNTVLSDICKNETFNVTSGSVKEILTYVDLAKKVIKIVKPHFTLQKDIIKLEKEKQQAKDLLSKSCGW